MIDHAADALKVLRDAAKAGIRKTDDPHRVIFKDGFVIEGRAADEWHSFMNLIIEVADKALASSSSVNEELLKRAQTAEKRLGEATEAFQRERARHLQTQDTAKDAYMRLITVFDQDATAGSFLSDDGEGGFAGGIIRMAREIDRPRSILSLSARISSRRPSA